jgi:hypothetical protein
MKRYITILVVVLVIVFSLQTVRAETYENNLMVGSSGSQVESLQTWLETNGYLTMPPGVAKGYFGARTRAALANYQKFLGLPNTGFFGPLTRAHFNKDVKVSSLTVTSPNGGENWAKGSYKTITWNAPQYFKATTVDIQLVPYNPPCPPGYMCTPPMWRPGYTIASNISVDQHAYVWNIIFPVTSIDAQGVTRMPSPPITFEGEYTIQICETGTSVCDSSDKPFIISKEQTIKPAVAVTSPNGGEKWPIKSVHQISWTNTDMSSTSKVDIYLVKYITCGGPVVNGMAPTCLPSLPAPIVLDKNIPTNQIYNWIVGTDIVNNPIPAGEYKMLVCVAGSQPYEVSGTCDYSNQPFSLIAEQSPLVFTVTTDKKEYTNNEDIQIHYQAYNPTNLPVTLTYTSGCKSKFTIGTPEIFDSMRGIACTMAVGQEIVNPRAVVSWDMVYSSGRVILPLGVHTINASLLSTEGSKASTQFTIK